MLRFLRIRNLAVVESVDVEFEPGFNVLTGETGAGKSIIVEAVGLLLGDRASSDLVRTGETQATIEAIFEVPVGPAKAVHHESAGAEPHELIIRRDITDHGRSRSFINGALATAGTVPAAPRVGQGEGVNAPLTMAAESREGCRPLPPFPACRHRFPRRVGRTRRTTRRTMSPPSPSMPIRRA